MPTEESDPFDFNVSAEEFLKSPEFYPDLSIIDGRAVRYPQLEPSPPDRWGNVPAEERLDWLGVFLTYRPAWLNLSAMASISRAHRALGDDRPVDSGSHRLSRDRVQSGSLSRAARCPR